MKKTYLLFFLMVSSWIFFSCSKKLYPAGDENQALLPVGEKVEKYNMQIDFMKNHFSGMLMVREMPDGEIRFVYNSYFGMSIFDVGLRNHLLLIHTMFEPLQGNRVKKLLENDFKLLFQKNQPFRKIVHSEEHTKLISGRGFNKTVIYLYKKTQEKVEHIIIKHPLIAIRLELEKISE